MVISRSNISNKWAKNVKWSIMTNAFLQFHICSYLVKWYMTWTFNHDLYTSIPSAFYKST